MMRKLVATACLALALAPALTGCTIIDPFSDADGQRIKAAVEVLFGELERADYTAAASHWCSHAPPASPPTAAELEASFSGFARPWKTTLVSSQYSDGSGVVNVTLTDGTGTAHPHNVDFTMTGGTTKVCDVDTGTVQIDVDI